MKSMIERIFHFLFLFSVVFIAFVLGAFITFYKLPPIFPVIEQVLFGATAWTNRVAAENEYVGDIWQPVRKDVEGVVTYNVQQSYPGLTLYTSGHGPEALLVDMEGKVVHHWALPFDEAWPEAPHIRYPVDERFIHWRRAWLYPNGDLLAIYVGIGDTPWGYGMVKLDKDSNLIWKIADHFHHDIEVAPDGTIYALSHDINDRGVTGMDMMRAPFLEDAVQVISPEGKVMRTLSLPEALRNSDLLGGLEYLLREVAEDYTVTTRDYLHTNTIKYIDEETAKHLPFAEAGQVLVSFRSIDTIAVIDLEEERATWALRGGWRGQHDPEFLDNGHLLLFDNIGHLGEGGWSRVLEIDPVTQQTLWQYAGDAAHPFFSKLRSTQQRLPNGNTLITESDGGRVFEVTPEKEVVWEYYTPHRGGPDEEYVAIIMGAQRFSQEALTFITKQ